MGYMFYSTEDMEIHAIITLNDNMLMFYSGWAVKYTIKGNTIYVKKA